MEELTIKETQLKTGVKYDIKGRITTTTTSKFEKTLDDALEIGYKNIVMNMAEVTIMTSVGIRIILKTFKEANKEGRRLLIEDPSEVVKNVLGLSNLAQMLVR